MKLSLSTFSLCAFVTLSLNACVSQTQSALPTTPTQSQQAQPADSAAIVHHLDVGQGQKTAASLSVAIQSELAGFKTQASSNGAIAKILADVDNYELFLFQCSALPTAGAVGSPTDLNSAPCTQSFHATVAAQGAANQTFVFENLAANTTGSRYFVGISAMETGPVANITQYTGFNTTGAHPAPGAIALSNSGGDSDGGVSVNASFALSNLAQLQVSVPLLNAVGAKLDSQVTVSNGATGLPGIAVN